MAAIIAARTPRSSIARTPRMVVPAGGADIVLELARVQPALQHHLAGADHRLGRQLIGQLPGDSLIDGGRPPAPR